MNIRLLAKHHLEFLILKGGCTGASESTHVKIPHTCSWKSHDTAHIYLNKKETSDFHGTVSFDPVKILQQK